MLCLIPDVKKLDILDGSLSKKLLCPPAQCPDSRLEAAVRALPCAPEGVPLTISLTGDVGEGYTLDIAAEQIRITAQGPAGAFYAIQTLRQLFRQDTVPCLHIEDTPDFAYRGFYLDVTRGKLPTLDTLKQLVDQMAYYKLNSLQLYIEHTLEMDEYKDVQPVTGCYTKAEIQALDDYCKARFIDLIPSLSTFGHLFELLNQETYRHLSVVKDYEHPNVWYSRMRHHTIDPSHPESQAVIASLIDQTIPAFSSPWFNICCDETFDLKEYEKQGKDPGQLYVDFVCKTVAHTKSRGKQVMMWADILLKHPQTIAQLPDDVCFLNWCYTAEPPEQQVAALAQTGKQQIVCPGTTTWNRFCEGVDREESNICRLVEYGHKYGALGVLNTNWGDYGNICSLEMSMYGLVLGAAKAWDVTTVPETDFYTRVNTLLYENENAMAYLQELSRLQDQVNWLRFVRNYHSTDDRAALPNAVTAPIEQLQQRCHALMDTLSSQLWQQDAYRQEMLLAAEGICLVAELNCKLTGTPCRRTTDARRWLERYRRHWLAKNKPQELGNIETILLNLEDLA